MRIAFCTGNAYGLLTKTNASSAGGAELQQVYIGKELAERGHDVFFIEEESEEKKQQSVDGVEIRLRKSRDASNRLSQVSSWISSTYDVINNIDPDITYMRVLSFELVPLYLATSLTSSKLVYCFANDSETTPNPDNFNSNITNSKIYKSVMHRALSSTDLLIAQNDFQYRTARRRFSTNVVQIPNGYPTDQVSKQSDLAPSIDRPIVLWVGNIRDVKGPLTLLELASISPSYHFLMVGGKIEQESELYDEIRLRSDSLENVQFKGYVPHSDIGEYYARASVLVNTSMSEGFPNTFLESWAHGVPVASLHVDPDGLIQENDLGIVADGDVDSLASDIGDLVAAQAESPELSERCERFLTENFSIESIADRYESEFLSLLDGR